MTPPKLLSQHLFPANLTGDSGHARMSHSFGSTRATTKFTTTFSFSPNASPNHRDRRCFTAAPLNPMFFK
jgi:hypothetical protein